MSWEVVKTSSEVVAADQYYWPMWAEHLYIGLSWIFILKLI